jgi:FMN phosphatase YigB (HAD superfamily)
MMFVFDFDNTLAMTSDPSPNNMNVDKAYKMAIDEIFGKEGVEIYEKTGGLRNEAPGEVVQRITALGFFPEKKNYPELLVEKKLAVLMSEIGEEWPLPYPGVKSFLTEAKEKGCSLGIISSGHEAFIRKTFEFWKVPCFDVIVTDDDFKGVTRKSKPDPTLFSYFCRKWAEKEGGQESFLEFTWVKWKEMVYFGDDPEKDGEFAKQAEVPFCHFCQSSPFQKKKNIIQFKDWREVGKFFF